MLPIVSVVVALILPLIVILRKRKKPVKKPFTFFSLSFICCLATLCTEIYTIKYRVDTGDIAGIIDTIDTVLLLCVAASAAVIIMNTIALSMISSETKTDTISDNEEAPDKADESLDE